MVDLGELGQRDDAGIGSAGHHPDREDGIARGDGACAEGGRTHDQAADVVQVDLHAVAVQQGVTAIRAVQAQGEALDGGAGAVGAISRQIAEDAAEVHRGGGAVLGRGGAIGLCVLGGQQDCAFGGGADGHAGAIVGKANVAAQVHILAVGGGVAIAVSAERGAGELDQVVG